eukprot:Em0116g8a
MELDENVQPASSRRSYTLSKDVLPPLAMETLVVTIVGSTELDGTTDINNSDNTEANLRVLISGDGAKFSRTSNFILLSYAILEPSIGQYLSGLGNHTIAVVKADSFVNVNGNPYPIELFLSSDMKFTLLTLGLNGANSIYACPFCTIHRDNRWDMSKAEAHFTNTVVRTLATLRCGFATNGKMAAQHKGSIHRPLTSIPLHHVILGNFEWTSLTGESVKKHGSMKQFSCQGVEKHNDDAKRNYFSSNQWDAPAEDRVQAGRAA